MVPSPSLSCRFVPYFNDTRLEAGKCQTGERVKGAWLLGFVLLGGSWGVDMRFLGGKWQKKKADPCGMTNKGRQRQRRGVGWAEVVVEKRISPLSGSQMREPLRSK